MPDIGFYHCTRAPAVEVAVRLIAKAYAAGTRILVTGTPASLAALDKALWTDDAESFLPHALARTTGDPAPNGESGDPAPTGKADNSVPAAEPGDPLSAGAAVNPLSAGGAGAGAAIAAEQPILLSQTADPVNGATLLLSLQAGVPPTFDRFDRILNLFEEGTEAHQRARTDWKALATLSEATRSYWQQKDQGGWEKKA